MPRDDPSPGSGQLGRFAVRLSRGAAGIGPPAPVRVVHLGIGNFARAHQAWYTSRAPDARDWGIAAFTGRRRDLADALAPQDGLYTLITRGAGGDAFAVISSLSAVHPAGDVAAWRRDIADPRVAVVTCTVTEAGYHRAPDGSLDMRDPAVAADIAALRADPAATVSTAPARLAAGLHARHVAGAGPVAIVPCDNLPGNGPAVARVVKELAAAVCPAMVSAVRATASFVSTMVDRITPATAGADRAAVTDATGFVDAAPVVTEPFSEWIIAGAFPTGRPDWEAAGARTVTDVEPFERRKLWLLNGAHSLLAYAGSILGHRTVAGAIGDPACRAWVVQWWDEASGHLGMPGGDVAAYRDALLGRFANPRMRHLLAQIATDGAEKLPVRILPVLRAELAAGRIPTGACRVLAAWVCHLGGAGAPVNDTAATRFTELARGPVDTAVPRVLGALDPGLADRPEAIREIVRLAGDLTSRMAHP